MREFGGGRGGPPKKQRGRPQVGFQTGDKGLFVRAILAEVFAVQSLAEGHPPAVTRRWTSRSTRDSPAKAAGELAK